MTQSAEPHPESPDRTPQARRRLERDLISPYLEMLEEAEVIHGWNNDSSMGLTWLPEPLRKWFYATLAKAEAGILPLEQIEVVLHSAAWLILGNGILTPFHPPYAASMKKVMLLAEVLLFRIQDFIDAEGVTRQYQKGLWDLKKEILKVRGKLLARGKSPEVLEERPFMPSTRSRAAATAFFFAVGLILILMHFLGVSSWALWNDQAPPSLPEIAVIVPMDHFLTAGDFFCGKLERSFDVKPCAEKERALARIELVTRSRGLKRGILLDADNEEVKRWP